MRLAMLGYYHETNTFSVTPTTYESFVRDGILRGAEIVQQHATAQSSLTGYLDAGEEFFVLTMGHCGWLSTPCIS